MTGHGQVRLGRDRHGHAVPRRRPRGRPRRRAAARILARRQRHRRGRRAGSTGESPTLSSREKAELFRAVGEAIRGRAKLICGTGTYSTAETPELTEAAEDAGADGLLVVTPYYNKPPQRGLIAHFERVADATDLPIIAYNILAIIRIEHDTCCSRCRAPQHRGGQGLDRRLPGGLAFDRRGAERFRGLLGDDWAAFGYACLGAVGVVSVASHLVGPQIHQMLELVGTGDVPAARKIHEQLAVVQRALHHVEPDPGEGRPEHARAPRRGAAAAARSCDDREESARVRAALEDAGLL